MKRVLFFLLISLVSCVSKGRYNKVLSSIQRKEKQQEKMNNQIKELRNSNRILLDSANKIGGKL